MKKISWVKINKILMFASDRQKAKLLLQEKYPIEFPIWRMRSRFSAVELFNYDEIIDEYATSGKEASDRKNKLLWGEV